MANDANAISSAGISLLAKNNKFFLPPRYSALDQADTFQIYEKSFTDPRVFQAADSEQSVILACTVFDWSIHDRQTDGQNCDG